MAFNGLNFLFDGNIDRVLVFSNTLIYFSFCYYETYFIMFWVKPKAFDENFKEKEWFLYFCLQIRLNTGCSSLNTGRKLNVLNTLDFL